MRYLADTSILSALSPFSGPANVHYRRWLGENAHLVGIPAVAVTELEQGVRKLFRIGADRKANELTRWLEGLLEKFSDSVVDFDLEAARVAGAMSDRLVSIGKHPGLADIYIAATAQARGLTVVTRNLRLFTPIGVPAMDPVDAQSQ